MDSWDINVNFSDRQLNAFASTNMYRLSYEIRNILKISKTKSDSSSPITKFLFFRALKYDKMHSNEDVCIRV